jgi:anti-sigma factor RsiW
MFPGELSHFSNEIWVDFVRGVLPSNEAKEIDRHLDDCPKCRQAYETWQAVADVARKDANHPSQDNIRRAKALFGWHQLLLFLHPHRSKNHRPQSEAPS